MFITRYSYYVFEKKNINSINQLNITFNLYKYQKQKIQNDSDQLSQRPNDNKVLVRTKGQIKKIILPSNKMMRPTSAPKKGQQTSEQISQIEKKISTIKDAYNLKGFEQELKGNQIRIRSANRRPNQLINNQNIKICVPKKGTSPGAEKQHQILQQQQNQALGSIPSQYNQNYQKYLVDANGTRGAITASIRFHRTPDQTSNRVFKVSKGQPILANHNNSSRGYLDTSQNSLQPLSQSHQYQPLSINQGQGNSKLRPTSANQGNNHRSFKRERSIDNQSYQHNISYTQGNMSFENSYNQILHYPYAQTQSDQPTANQKFPYQYPVIKRRNDQYIDQKHIQNNSSGSFNQGTNSSFHNNSNSRLQNNNNGQQNGSGGFSNSQSTGYSTRGFGQQQIHQQQQRNNQQQNGNYVKQQSPYKIKREVTFSEEDEVDTKQMSNRKGQQPAQYNNYFQSGSNHQDYSYNQGNNSTNVSHSHNNYQSYNNASVNNYSNNNGYKNQQPHQYPPNQTKQTNNHYQNNRKHYDDFQPDDVDQEDQYLQDIQDEEQEQEEVNEVIQEEEEDEVNYPRSASAAVQHLANNVVENYELDWEEENLPNEDGYLKEGTQDAYVKKNQNQFLNNLKQHQDEEKQVIDKDLEKKKKEQEELQRRIQELKEQERKEQQKQSEQERVKKQQLIEINEREQQINKRIQDLIQTENEEKEKYAKLKEQEEKERLSRLQELEKIAQQAEEQKQRLEEIMKKELQSSHTLQRLGNEELSQIKNSDHQSSSSSSKRVQIKNQSGLDLQVSSWQGDRDQRVEKEWEGDKEFSYEDQLNQYLKANTNYLVISQFCSTDIHTMDALQQNLLSSSRSNSSIVSTRKGLLAVVFEINLQMLIIIYVDNQIRLQTSQNSQLPQMSSSSLSSLRHKNDQQWQHSIDWSDCSLLFESKSSEEIKTLFQGVFDNQIKSHLRVNLKERLITLADLNSIQITNNCNSILLKVCLKKNIKQSYIEIDNSSSALIEHQTTSLLEQDIEERDIIKPFVEKKCLTSVLSEKAGVFAVYYHRKNKQLIFEFVSYLSDTDFTRKIYHHTIDLIQMAEHYNKADYLTHQGFSKVVQDICAEYQKVDMLVRLVDEKLQGEQYHMLKIPFSSKWTHTEIVQDTPKHTIEATFLLVQSTILGQTALQIEETLKEKQKTELTEEDYENLLETQNDVLLQTVDEKDIIDAYHKAAIISVKNKKVKHGILGAYFNRENNNIIIEFIAVRNFDIEDTHTYQHTINLRLICEHYGGDHSYLTSDEVTNVVTHIISQYKQVQSQITIEPHYLKVPFNQDWMFEEITENDETKIYTFFNFSTRAQGKTIIEKKQTIQNLIPLGKKNSKKSQKKYNEAEEGAANKIQKHYKAQNEYRKTKNEIQKTKQHIFAKAMDIDNLPYFITFFKDLTNQSYYVTLQSLSARKNQSIYLHFKQLITAKIQQILQTPDLFFSYYILNAQAKQFTFSDKENIAASKITNFFFRIKKQKSTENKVKKADLPFRVRALRKINYEDKYYLFTIVENLKNKRNQEKSQFIAKIETLNQTSINKWKSEVKLTSVFAKSITSQNKQNKNANLSRQSSLKQKKINPFNYFDIDFEKRQIHVKLQAEKQIASQYISKHISGQYSLQAKTIINNPFKISDNFLLSIIKTTNKKSRGYSAIIESIKSNEKTKINLNLSALEAKYLIAQIRKNSLSFETEFNLEIKNKTFELKKERRQIIAQTYIVSFIKSRLRFRKLFKELFIYQIRKNVSTEIHGKKVKYMFAIIKKLKDQITTAKVSVTQGKNKINKNLIIPNVFGKLFNLENRLMKDQWDPTNYQIKQFIQQFEIDPENGFFEWKKGKKEEVAIKLIISCIRRRNFQRQLKTCSTMKLIQRVTPSILLTIRSIDNQATPYLIRSDYITKSSSLKAKPGLLRITQQQFDIIISSDRDIVKYLLRFIYSFHYLLNQIQ